MLAALLAAGDEVPNWPTAAVYIVGIIAVAFVMWVMWR